MPREQILTAEAPQPRPSVAATPGFAKAEGRHGKLRLDLSEYTGETPEHVLEAIRATPGEELAAYPEYEAFTAELATYLGVEPECVCIFAGSDEGLRIIVQSYFDAGDTGVVVTPSFPMYPLYLKLIGAHTVEVELGEKPPFAFDLAGICNALESGAKGLFVPSPTNPTGTWVAPQTWVELAKEFPESLIVVDEAYADFAPQALVCGGHSLGAGEPAVTRMRNLVVTGSFSKALGLAGLRIGWAVAHPSVIEVLSRVRSPYSVNAVAMRATRALMLEPQAISQRLAAVLEGKQRLIEGLAALEVPTFVGEANAVLAFVGDEAAPRIAAALKGRGILVRDVSKQPLLAGTLRISAGLVPQVDTLLAALAEEYSGAG